jgi:DNA-directed RNA polymerase specialized sigma24 family protein
MGHAREFDALIRDHGAMISRICASYERNPEIARELVQDVLFAIWRALPKHRGEGTLKTFAARIVQFRAISHVVRQSRLPENEPVSEDLMDHSAMPETEGRHADNDVGLIHFDVASPPITFLTASQAVSITSSLQALGERRRASTYNLMPGFALAFERDPSLESNPFVTHDERPQGRAAAFQFRELPTRTHLSVSSRPG